MPAGREIFKLFGMIGMHGVDKTNAELNKVEKQARRVQREVNKMGRAFTKAGKTISKVFTLPLLAAGAATIKMIEKGGDLNETISKTNELFGQSSKEIQAWAATAAGALGQSKQEAMDAAGTFAIFGKSAGLAGSELVKFAKENTQLASDMASFFNTKPADAIQAIGAAYRGETEPIRRYGVMLDDATMRQKALELGLVSTTKKALLPQTKVLAAQALIFDKTKAAQGDFARTSDQLANKKRILAARIENVSASIGSLFLPLALKAVNEFGRLADKVEAAVEWWRNLNASTKRTIAGFVILLGATGPLIFAWGKLVVVGGALVKAFVAIKTTGLLKYLAGLSKSTLVAVGAFGALAAVVWYYYSQWDTVSKQLVAIWESLKLSFVRLNNWIVESMAKMFDKVLQGLDKVSGVIPGFSAKIKEARVSLLRFRAEVLKSVIAQRQHRNAAHEAARGTDGFLKSVKKSIEAAKARIGITRQSTEELKVQTQAEIEAAEAAKKAAEAKAAAEKKLVEDKKAFNQSLYAELDALQLTEREQLDREYGLQMMEAERLGADIYAVKELYSLKAIELQKREAKEKNKIAKTNFSTELNLLSKLQNVVSRFSSNKLAEIDNEAQRQISAIENSQLSEEKKEKAIQSIREQSDKKRQDMQRKQARQEKVFALFQIALSTAAAVVKALPNIPLSVAVGLIGAAEGAAAAAQPIPLFEGAMVKGSENGVNAQVGERNQDELVFPLERGIGLITSGVVEKLSNIINAPVFGGPAPETLSPPTENRTSEVHYHIGTLIADKSGIKQLERELNKVRIAEDQRKGAI